MERQKIDDRKQLSYMRKDLAANKSNNKCCHCGKRISFNRLPHTEKATIEHFIPLDKGGTNDVINLVALCESCNKEKGNFIYWPEDYLKFINPQYLKEIQGHFDEYIDSVDFVNRNNLFACDRYIITFSYVPAEVMAKIKDKKKREALKKRANTEVWFKRATYKDLDRLAKVLFNNFVKRNEKNNNEACMNASRSHIELWLEYGCVYYSENKDGDINTFSAVLVKEDNLNNQVDRYLEITSFSLYGNDKSLALLTAFSDTIPKIILQEQDLKQIPVSKWYPNRPLKPRHIIHEVDDCDINPNEDDILNDFFNKFGASKTSEYNMKFSAISYGW